MAVRVKLCCGAAVDTGFVCAENAWIWAKALFCEKLFGGMKFAALGLLADIMFVIPELVGVKTPIVGLGTRVDDANGAVCGDI